MNSCNSQTLIDEDKDQIFINPSVIVSNEFKSDYEKIIKTLNGFQKTKNNDFYKNSYWIETDTLFIKYPLIEIFNIENTFKGKYKYKPTLLSLTKVEGFETKINAKIAWIGSESNEFSSLRIIYNLELIKYKESFKIQNVLSTNVKNWKKAKIGDVQYYYYPDFDFDEKKAAIFNAFNTEIALFFETNPIEFKYFLCKDVCHFMKIRGYDFEESMFFSNQNGAEAMPYERLIFSGNDSEINKHELVHLYTYIKHKNKNSIIDEGVATYFGGSKGLTYTEHLRKLKNHLRDNKIDIYNELFYKNYVLDDLTSLKYTVGAFLCDLAMKKGGKSGLFKLLNSGKSNDELIQTIENLFNLKKENFNIFIKNELENYNFREE
jgi:hypothetical protein